MLARLRDAHHAAVLVVAVVQRDPRRDTVAGLHAEVEVVLVKVLPPRARRLEIEHRLYGQRLLADQRLQHLADPSVEQVPTRDRADRMFGVQVRHHHARVERERIVDVVGDLPVRLDLAQARDRAVGVRVHEGIPDRCDLVRGQQTAGDAEAISIERRLHCR
jgi:hypothetical protein